MSVHTKKRSSHRGNSRHPSADDSEKAVVKTGSTLVAGRARRLSHALESRRYEWEKNLVTRVHREPFRSVLSAAAIGWIAGRWLRRR
jgi:hypothetical protein